MKIYAQSVLFINESVLVMAVNNYCITILKSIYLNCFFLDKLIRKIF